MSDYLVCAGCGEHVARWAEPADVRLSALQTHDRECLTHDFNGVPCRHPGSCYAREAGIETGESNE